MLYMTTVLANIGLIINHGSIVLVYNTLQPLSNTLIKLGKFVKGNVYKTVRAIGSN